MTEPNEEEVIKQYMSSLGKKGGKAKGDCKKRNQDDPDYYTNIHRQVEKVCDACEKPFIATTPSQKRCSPECSRKKFLEYQRKKQKELRLKLKQED